eukprot:TRINITY_DN9886_c0_g1_i1.p1 TRINITY_DN9886_c0_g1~~TRINITY_DN9886_c0_g1_i1.p1  ORF type:complete len:147 (+),score=33.05 TRINITY_DN9886_c0_g1_i1:69-509(+)
MMFSRRMVYSLVSKLTTMLHLIVSKLMMLKHDATTASSNIPIDADKIWLRIQEIDADDISPDDSISNVDCEEDWRSLADVCGTRPEDSMGNVEKLGVDPAAEQDTLSTEDDANTVNDAQSEGSSLDLDGSNEDMSDASQLQQEILL